MSDCSTEATKPKEPPKTCGSCGNVEVTIHKVRCPHRRYPMERFRDWIGYPRYEHYAEDEACENYIPANDTLEQRYQQLEQVARELFSCLYKALMRPDGVPPDGLIDEAEYLSYRLIRLGVSLDG